MLHFFISKLSIYLAKTYILMISSFFFFFTSINYRWHAFPYFFWRLILNISVSQSLLVLQSVISCIYRISNIGNIILVVYSIWHILGIPKVHYDMCDIYRYRATFKTLIQSNTLIPVTFRINVIKMQVSFIMRT